jgi:hypothetical protein
MQSQQAQPQQTQQLQSAGFILIPTEEDAYRYPVALGKCMTFKVENEPIVIEKSMSFSQLENPRIDRYRLVREDIVEEPKAIESVEVEQSHDDGLMEELQAIRRDLEGIKEKLNSPSKTTAKKKEDSGNE